MEVGKVAVLTGIAAAVGVGLIAMLERRPVANPLAPVEDVDYMQCLRDAARYAERRNPKSAKHLRTLFATLERVPAGNRRDRVAAAMRILDKRLTCLPEWKWTFYTPPGPSIDDPLLPAYTRASEEIQARIILGETPAQISDGLTPAEAHQWLTEDPNRSPAEWLLWGYKHRVAGTIDVGTPGPHITRYVPVARWVIQAWDDPVKRSALLRQRVDRGPHGEEIEGRWIDRIDELRPQDLRPSIRETFERAAVRLTKEIERAMGKEHKPLAALPRWWYPIKCARPLMSPSELAIEGKVMRHCVATYVPYVKGGKSVIVAINVRGKRSTAEIDRQTVGVIQHKGVGNIEPPELCERALQVCLTYWRGQKKKPELP